MADTRFFDRSGPFTLAELAARIKADLADPAHGDRPVYDVAPLDRAGPADLTFLDNPKYGDAFRETIAGAAVLSPKHQDKAPDGMALLLSNDPYRAYALAAQAFYPGSGGSAHFGESEIQGTVHASAKLGEGVVVEPGAVIGEHAEIGAGTIIGANAVVSRGCTIGRHSYIGPNATVSHAMIGDKVIIHPGVQIGQDGFGFAMGLPHHEKVPQLGRVIIQDNVEIGANSTIDRGAGPDTVIGEGTKIDNLVQIGHNVSVGRGCIIVSQTGISGSTVLEDFVVLAARVGVTGHLTIGMGAQIAARSSVIHNVPAGEQWGGTPAKPVSQWRREIVAVQKLGRPKKKN
jgi:UDP-3-O-[3-hydroxymyristoyl] glucosamine N-acyltransferase